MSGGISSDLSPDEKVRLLQERQRELAARPTRKRSWADVISEISGTKPVELDEDIDKPGSEPTEEGSPESVSAEIEDCLVSPGFEADVPPKSEKPRKKRKQKTPATQLFDYFHDKIREYRYNSNFIPKPKRMPPKQGAMLKKMLELYDIEDVKLYLEMIVGDWNAIRALEFKYRNTPDPTIQAALGLMPGYINLALSYRGVCNETHRVSCLLNKKPKK